MCPRFRHSAGSWPRACSPPWCVVRFRRHHRFRLAVGPLRQSIPAVLVLRLGAIVAAVPTVHQLLVLRTVAVCDVLRSRLDRHGAADSAAHRAAVRSRTRQSGFLAGFLRAISLGVWQLRHSAPACHAPLLATYLPAFLRRRRIVHRGGIDHAWRFRGCRSRWWREGGE